MKTISNGTKVYLAIFLSLFISPLTVLAAANSITFSDTSYLQLLVGGVTRTFTVNNSSAESVTVYEPNGYFTVDFAAGGAGMTIVSSDRLSFTVSPSTVNKIFTCGTGNSTLELQRGSSEGAVTVTVTPSSSDR